MIAKSKHLMSNDYKYSCKCSCGNVHFNVPYKPKKIVRCHCSICRSLHKIDYAQFSKYDKNDIIIDIEKLDKHEATSYAARYSCKQCNQWICMIYKKSQNIWIIVDLFLFDYDNIPYYDIYDSNYK